MSKHCSKMLQMLKDDTSLFDIYVVYNLHWAAQMHAVHQDTAKLQKRAGEKKTFLFKDYGKTEDLNNGMLIHHMYRLISIHSKGTHQCLPSYRSCLTCQKAFVDIQTHFSLQAQHGNCINKWMTWEVHI